jgi:hypothetical protein
MMNRRAFSLTAAAAGVAVTAGANTLAGQSKGGNNMYRELFELSLKEKKGLLLYVNGQTIPAIVTRMIGDDAVEVRNQQVSRAIVRIDRIDAVTMS